MLGQATAERPFVVVLRILRGRRGEITARHHRHVVLAIDGRIRQRRVASRNSRHIAARRDRAADVLRHVIMPTVQAVACADVLRGLQADRADVDVAARPDRRITPGLNCCAVHVDIASSQCLNVVGGGNHARCARALRGNLADKARRARRSGHAQSLSFVRDVATGSHHRIDSADPTAHVAHILHGSHCRRAAATDHTPVDDGVADDRRGHVADDMTAVRDVPRTVQVDLAPSQNRATVLQIDRIRLCQIQFRYQHGLMRAIGQSDVLRDKPDHIGRQLAHLFVRQADADREIERLRIRDAVVHQRRVFVEIVRIASEERAPGELRHLVAHQPFFIRAVTEPLDGGLRIHAELTEHVVARYELRI
ncbi:hypothetical protein FEP90_04902 [Burkholderia multivorans]|nr:hypothetical protein [Burkholderia multivorans]